MNTIINLEDNITPNFKWKEALWLPTFQVYHIPSEQEIENIKQIATIMEEVRAFLEQPINVHCWIRPTSVNCPDKPGLNGKNYNAAVFGAPKSAHIVGKAVDFSVSRITCDDVRFHLLPLLDQYKLRMEDRPGSGWVHLDCQEPLPGGKRFFKP